MAIQGKLRHKKSTDLVKPVRFPSVHTPHAQEVYLYGPQQVGPSIVVVAFPPNTSWLLSAESTSILSRAMVSLSSTSLADSLFFFIGM
jgi:hypothetical protein